MRRNAILLQACPIAAQRVTLIYGHEEPTYVTISHRGIGIRIDASSHVLARGEICTYLQRWFICNNKTRCINTNVHPAKL
eukprot:scaffold90939_cov58-Cyclotella_meneghiniana.AAC.1